MKSLALFAVVAFVAVGGFPTSPVLPPPYPYPAPKKIIHSSSSSSAQTQSASSQDRVTSEVRTDAYGRTVRTSTDDHSAEAAAARSNQRADQQTIFYKNGDVAKSASSHNDAAASEAKSASKDHRLYIKDRYGNSVSEIDKASSASAKKAASSKDKNKYSYKSAGGGYSSGSSERESAANSDAKSADKDYSKTVRNAKGGSTTWTDKGSSASRDANSSSGSKRRNTWIGAHGERTDTDSSRARADSSHAASASAEKGYVSIGPKGKKVIATDKSSSAEKKAASQYTHGDHGYWRDASGNTASWGQDGDHRKSSEGKSASRDRTLIVDDGKGNVKVNKEKAKSASKKADSSDVHKQYKNVHNIDGSGYSSSGVDKQAASSKGQSASIDKVSKRIKKGGIIEITKEKRDSASEDANSSSGSERRNNWRGAHGERKYTDSSRKRAGSSHAASASADKSYVSIGPKGKKVIATDKSSSAEKKAASQYTHGDHGYWRDASGNTASWGQDGDHRKSSEGKSASRDRTLIVDDGKGNVKVNKEKAKSASKKADSSDVHKQYKNVHNIDGSGYSSSGVDKQAASSKGQSASIDKVSKRIKKGGIIEITKEKRDSASEDANSSSGSERRNNWRGAHGERKYTDSSRKRAGSSHAASASSDKSYVSIGPKGKKVIATDKSSSAEKKAASQYTHGDHGYWRDASGNTASWGQDGDHRKSSEGKSASRDRTLIVDDGKGNVKVNKEKAKSASKKADSSDVHKQYKNVHNIDGSGYSSSGVDKQAASSKGQSASIDKVSKRIKKGGIIEITKEKRDSASEDANSSSGSERRNNWRGAHGERKYTDSSRKRAGSSHAASASADKSYVSIGPKGKKVIATDKSSSAEKKAASQYTHGDHGYWRDASGNTASWGQDGDHRKSSEGKSASRDRTLIVDDGKGNVKVNKEKAKSASKKADSSDVHKQYKNVHNIDGSGYSSSGVDKQAASSKGQSASIDKVSKRIKKGGIIEITKEKRDSASEDANSSSGSERRNNWRGAHGERKYTDSSRKRAGSSHAASASSDKSYVSIGPKGKKVIATDKSSSAEKKAASQYTHGDHGYWRDASGNTASWGQDGDHRKSSEGKSASRDRTLIVDDGKGNVKVNKEKAKSASKKADSSDVHKQYKNVHNIDGSGYSSSGVDKQAASSKGQSASIDKVSKRIKKGGIIEITKEKRDSASEDANSSSGSERRNNWRGAHGERKYTDSSRKRAGSSHAASASADKSYVSIGPKGKKVIATDKSSSAEKKAASQYTHGDHGYWRDASGNTASWGQDGDHRKSSEGKSASRDRTLIVDDGKGNVKVNKEKAKSASKKADSSDVHKQYKNVHNIDGSGYSSSGVDKQAASSKGQSASIDKVSKRIKKGGIIEITKEKRDSASEDANSSSGSERRNNWRGAHGERKYTDSSRKRAGSSHAASASADKSYVSIGPKGKKVIATDKSSSAEKKAASQYTHGDHGYWRDASGNTASWGQDGDHRKSSEGKSASRDRTLIVDDGKGNVKVNKEKAKSASKKADSSDVHKQYKNVHNIDGSGYSSSGVDKQAASSKGQSASIDKVSKRIKKGGIIEITKEKRDSASEDANSSSGSERRNNWRGAHGERKYTDSSRKRAGSSHAASASADKSYVSIGPKGKKVIATDKSSSAEKKAASQYTHGDHGYWRDASGNTASWGQDGDHRKSSEGKSASRDRTLIVDDGKGNVKVNKEKAKSASKKADSSDVHKQYKNVHNIDGSGYSSSVVDKQAASSKGQSASIDKVSKRIKKGGIIEITKEKRDSASEDANSSSGSERRNNWRGAHGERKYTDSSRKRAGSSHAASASADKSYVSIGPKGKKVIATDKSSSAEKKAASQYTHGDHGYWRDASGNTASWGQDGDHRKSSEGKSASRDRTLIVDDGKGNVKVNKEKAKSASKKADSSDVHKQYKNVHNIDGSGYSSSGVDKQAASSKGQSASIDKVSKRIKKGGIIEITKEKRDSASEDANSSSGSERRNNWRGAHGERKYTDSSRKRAGSSHAASASADKSYVSIGPKGKKVIATDKSSSAEKKAASQYTHGDHGYWRDASGNTASWGQDGDHRKSSEGKSASRDRTLIVDDGKGNVKVNKEKAKSASKKADSSDVHKQYKNVHNIDGSGYSSSVVDKQAASSKGQSASIDKVSKTIKKGGITEITKEKRDSASVEDNSSNSHSENNIKRNANGGYVSSSASSSNAASNRAASESHDNEYRKNDGHGGKISVINKGNTASKDNRSSNDYKNTNAYSDGKGNYRKSSSSGSNAAKDEAASEKHDNEYTKEDASGKVKVINKGEGQSKETANSGTYQGTDSYHTAGGGSGWSSYKGNHAAKEEAAAEKHDNEYTKEDAYGKVKVINKGEGQSKGSASSSDYQSKNAYTDGHGNSRKSTSSGSNAAKDEAASEKHDNEYTKEDASGKVKVINKGESQSKETANSGTYQGTNSYHTAGGGRGWSSYKGDHEAIEKAAAEKHDNEYTNEDAWGKVKVINRGDSKSKETGSETDYENKSAYTDGKGNSAVTSTSGRNAAASQAASTNYDKIYSRKNKDGSSEYSRDTGSGASESSASAQQQQSTSSFTGADGSFGTSNEKSRAAKAHQAASANNDAVSITRNADGSSVYKKSKTEAASVADASSSEDEKDSTYVDADGNIVTSSSKSSKAEYSSASSSSSSSEEVIDYC